MMSSDPTPFAPTTTALNRFREVASYFLRLGLTGFGGPAAHMALMHHEVVEKRKWVDEQKFLDLLGTANLLPGPSSTEMAIFLGYLRAGWPGLIAGGVCFILPAMLMVILLAWIYQQGQTLPFTGWVMTGVKPVVIAIVFQALWTLGKKAVKNWPLGTAGLVVILLYLVGVNVIGLLLGSGVLIMVIENRKRIRLSSKLSAITPIIFAQTFLNQYLPAINPLLFSLPLLFLEFLKIGAVLFGSGYVLLAFLRFDLVTQYHWLTDKQLLDAIAIGQVTPGPVFTTATFIGFLLGGVPGALLSTLAIFLPAFFYVAISGPFISKIRQSSWAGCFLDGVNVASLGLMAGVIIQLGQSSLTDPISITIGIVSALILFRLKVNPTWLILGGAIFGVLKGMLL
jgi:chromate transporter